MPDDFDQLEVLDGPVSDLSDPTFWRTVAAMFRQPGIWLLWLVGSTEDNTEGFLAPLVGMAFWGVLLISYCAWIFYG